MKYLLPLILALLVLSCSKQGSISDIRQKERFSELEKMIWSDSESVLDSISDEYNHLLLSSDRSGKKIKMDEQTALLTIYYNIAYEQSYGLVKSDSMLTPAKEWFTKKGDNLNICRALLLKSIYYTGKDKQDSSAYRMLKNAESIYTTKHIDNPALGALLYLYLGKIYRAREDDSLALEYYYKAKKLSVEQNYKKGVLNTSLELFNYYIGKREYGDALTSIACFGDETNLTPYIEYEYYSGMYLYYVSKKDYTIAIEFLKKILAIKNNGKFEINYPKIYYQLANQYKRLNEKDSTLSYAIKSVKSIKDSTATDSHFYYKYLGETYASSGDYKTAIDYYKRGHNSYVSAYTRQSLSRLLEVNRKYDISLKDREIESLRKERTIFINLSIALVAILGLILFFYIRSSRSVKIGKRELTKKMEDKVRENGKLWLISEIGRSNSNILPQVIDNVYLEAARARKVSNEVFDSLNKIIDQANTLSRSALSSITNNETFETFYGNMEVLKQLTDFEKLVFILSEEGFSNQEIANYLNSSQTSIRTVKGKIVRKTQKITGENSSET